MPFSTLRGPTPREDQIFGDTIFLVYLQVNSLIIENILFSQSDWNVCLSCPEDPPGNQKATLTFENLSLSDPQ